MILGQPWLWIIPIYACLCAGAHVVCEGTHVVCVAQFEFSCAEYDDDRPLKDSGSTPPKVADIFRSASLQWSDNGNSSFRSIKKKLQRATTEIRHTGSPT